MRKCLNQLSITSYVRFTAFLERHQVLFLFLFGLLFLALGASEHSQAQNAAYKGQKYGDICKKILEMHSTGGYGALLTSLSGIGAILASAMGGFKAAWGLLVVAISSFILDSYRKLFFGDSCK